MALSRERGGRLDVAEEAPRRVKQPLFSGMCVVELEKLHIAHTLVLHTSS